MFKEVFKALLLEAYDQEDSFLNKVRNMDEDVENGIINLFSAGIDPNVIKNPSSFPLTIKERVDTKHSLALDTYATEPEVIHKLEELQRSYSKMQSIARRTAQALVNKNALDAIYNYAPPVSNNNDMPVVEATGALTTDLVFNHKMITEGDIARLAKKFDILTSSSKKPRTLVLSTQHFWELAETSPILKAQMGYQAKHGIIDHQVYKLHSFDIERYEGNVVYADTGAKQAQGTAVTATRHGASIAFVNDEVMRAVSGTEVFTEMDKPTYIGSLINAANLFTALPFRQKYIGAIRSVA